MFLLLSLMFVVLVLGYLSFVLSLVHRLPYLFASLFFHLSVNSFFSDILYSFFLLLSLLTIVTPGWFPVQNPRKIRLYCTSYLFLFILIFLFLYFPLLLSYPLHSSANVLPTINKVLDILGYPFIYLSYLPTYLPTSYLLPLLPSILSPFFSTPIALTPHPPLSSAQSYPLNFIPPNPLAFGQFLHISFPLRG